MTQSYNQPKPASMKVHRFKQTWTVSAPVANCWNILNRMETFTEGQLFPYKVEFLAEDGEPPRFETGVWTNHHGPLLNVCGQIGKMIPNSFRELNYCYGSYVCSCRIIRPVKLQFFFEDLQDSTKITLQLDCYVHRVIYPLWTTVQSIFWSGFNFFITKKIKSLAKS